MNTRQKLHQIHLNEWASRFADQKASGLTVRQWCQQNNYSVHSYTYWKHILKEELASQMLPDIVPLTPPHATFQHESIAPAASMKNSSSVSCLTNRATFTNTATLTIISQYRLDLTYRKTSFVPLSRRCATLKDADPKYFAGIYIVCGYTDLRYGIDSLAAIIERRYHQDKRTPLGRRWFPASLQACGKRTFLMAT